MRLITASALTRTSKCPGSHSAAWYGTESDDATAGTRRHRLLEALYSHSLAAALELCADDGERELVETVDQAITARFGRGATLTEVSLALDLVTGNGRIVGRSRDYASALPATEVAGTLDVLMVRTDAPLVVLDWKGAWADVDPPSSNQQLRFLGLAAARQQGVSSVEIGIVRLREGEAPWIETTVLDEFELDAVLDEMRGIHRRASEPGGAFTQGSWCRYCPAFDACPAKVGLARALALSPAEAVRVADGPGDLTPEQAAEALRRVKAAESVIARIKSALHAFAARRPIPVGEGVQWGPVTTTRKEIDGAVALKVLGELYGRQVAEVACEPDTSAAAIERALKPVAKGLGKKLAPMLREAMALIEAQGGIHHKPVTIFEEHPAVVGEVGDGRAA